MISLRPKLISEICHFLCLEHGPTESHIWLSGESICHKIRNKITEVTAGRINEAIVSAQIVFELSYVIISFMLSHVFVLLSPSLFPPSFSLGLIALMSSGFCLSLSLSLYFSLSISLSITVPQQSAKGASGKGHVKKKGKTRQIVSVVCLLLLPILVSSVAVCLLAQSFVWQGRVLGLSKFARLLAVFARRPQLQEQRSTTSCH